MAKLSKESERKITNALEKVAELIADGVHPDNALIKIAGEHGIPAGHIHLMVNAINIGRTNAQRLSRDNPDEKAAVFALADTHNVLKALYPDTVKTKNAAHMTTAVSDDYTRKPRWIENKKLREKAASVDFKLTDKQPDIERYQNCPVKEALAVIEKASTLVEEKRRDLTAVRNKAIKLAADLNDYFMTPGHIPYNEVKENCFLLFGDAANAVLARNVKEAATTTKTRTPVRMTNAPYSLVKSAIILAYEFKEKQAEYNDAVAHANREADKHLRPFAPAEQHGRSVLGRPSLTDVDLQKDASFGTLFGNGLGIINGMNIAKSVASKIPGMPTDPGAQREGDLLELMDPGHESEIRNVQSEALLNDLMANDDIIRGHDPEDVIDAFNEVSQIAPFASNKKAIMRDLLRKRLSGGPQALDQFTVGDALKTQQLMQDLSLPKKENLSVLSSIGAFGNAGKPADKLA